VNAPGGEYARAGAHPQGFSGRPRLAPTWRIRTKTVPSAVRLHRPGALRRPQAASLGVAQYRAFQIEICPVRALSTRRAAPSDRAVLWHATCFL